MNAKATVQTVEVTADGDGLVSQAGAYLLTELTLAEPKRLRQRLLHVAGRIARSGRRVTLRLPTSWPWAEALVAAFRRLRALPLASPA